MIKKLIKLAKIYSDQAEYENADRVVDKLISLIKNKRYPIINKISFVLTYRCNLHCNHCYIYNTDSYYKYKMKHHQNQIELSLNEINKIIEKSKLLRNVDINFTGGEIFIRDDINEVLYSFANKGLKFDLFYNGTFPDRLNKLLSNQKIRNSIRLVSLSFDGDKEIVDLMRGENVYEKLIESIKILKLNNIKIKLGTVITKDNINKLQDIFNLGKQLNCYSHVFNLQMDGNKYLKIDDLKKVRSFLFPDRYFRIVNESIYKGSGCLAGIDHCNFVPGGVVEACSISKIFNHFILGNIKNFNYDFDALWFSSNAQEVRYFIRDCIGCANHCERGQMYV